MGDFGFLGSYEWWFSVLVMAILANLVSDAIKKYAPVLLGKFSKRWEERSEKARKERKDKIAWLLVLQPHLRFVL